MKKTGDGQDSASKAHPPPSTHQLMQSVRKVTADIRQETPTLFPITGVPDRTTSSTHHVARITSAANSEHRAYKEIRN